jgi:lipopolysaccharide transport system permease protein
LRDLLRELVVRDLKIRYKDSALGVAWSFINPLLHLLIFYFLFRLVLALNIRRYSSFAFCGMVAWTWFQASLSQAAGAIKSSRELVRQPGFPTIILPVVSVTANLINFLIALPILMLVLVAGGSQIGISILELPIIMVIQFVLTLSLAYLVAATNVLFRDTQHILGVLLQLYFFLTPVFYDASAVPERYRIFYDLNPMVHLVESYRAILLHGIEPHWMPLLFLSFVSVVLLRISLKVFIRASDRFVEEL